MNAPKPACVDCGSTAPLTYCLGCPASLCSSCAHAWDGSLRGLCLKCGSERIDAEDAAERQGDMDREERAA